MTAVIFKIAFVKARRYLYIYKQNSVNISLLNSFHFFKIWYKMIINIMQGKTIWFYIWRLSLRIPVTINLKGCVRYFLLVCFVSLNEKQEHL